MSTEAQPPTPPQHPAVRSRYGDTQQQNYGPPIAFNAQTSKRRHGRSSSLGEKASKFFSHIRPSRRPEKGHTIRKDIDVKDPRPESVLDRQRWTRSLDTGRSNNEFSQANPVNSRSWSSADGSEDKPDHKHKTTLKRIFRSFSLKHGRKDSDSQSKVEYIDESTQYQTAHNIPSTSTQHPQLLESQTSGSTRTAEHYEGKVTSQQVCEDKIPRREERRRLKESGDYLGVQGVNPFTGVVDISESTSYQTSEETQWLLAKARGMIEQLERNMGNEPAMVRGAPDAEEVRAAQRECAPRFKEQMRQGRVEQYSFTDSTRYSVAERDAERDPFLSSVTSSRPVCPATCDCPACDLDPAQRGLAEFQRQWKEILRKKEERIAKNAAKRAADCGITPTPAENLLAARSRARRAREDRLATFRLFPQPPRHLPVVNGVANSTGIVEHGHSSPAANGGEKLADTKQNIIPRKPVASPSRRVLDSSANTIIHTTSALSLQSPPVAQSSMEDNITNRQHVKVVSNGHEPTLITKDESAHKRSRSFLDDQQTPYNIPIRTSSLRQGHGREITAISSLAVLMNQLPIHQPLAQSQKYTTAGEGIESTKDFPPASSPLPLVIGPPSSVLHKPLLQVWPPPTIPNTQSGQKDQKYIRAGKEVEVMKGFPPASSPHPRAAEAPSSFLHKPLLQVWPPPTIPDTQSGQKDQKYTRAGKTIKSMKDFPSIFLPHPCVVDMPASYPPKPSFTSTSTITTTGCAAPKNIATGKTDMATSAAKTAFKNAFKKRLEQIIARKQEEKAENFKIEEEIIREKEEVVMLFWVVVVGLTYLYCSL